MYRFRFERLLALREELERRAAVELGRVDAARRRERERLRALQEEERRLRGLWLNMDGGSESMADILVIKDYRRGISSMVKAQEEVLALWEERYRKALATFNEARKAKRALEILRERGLKAYNERLERMEREALDEIGVTMFLRSKVHQETSDNGGGR